MKFLTGKNRVGAAILAAGLAITALHQREDNSTQPKYYDTERFIRDVWGADYLEVTRIYPGKYLGIFSDAETRYIITHITPERISIRGTDVEAGKKRAEADCGPSQELARRKNGRETKINLNLLNPEAEMGCLERGR